MQNDVIIKKIVKISNYRLRKYKIAINALKKEKYGELIEYISLIFIDDDNQFGNQYKYIKSDIEKNRDLYIYSNNEYDNFEYRNWYISIIYLSIKDVNNLIVKSYDCCVLLKKKQFIDEKALKYVLSLFIKFNDNIIKRGGC